MNPRGRSISRSGAFTLVELLVVIVVIGVLAAVSAPLVTNAMDDSRTSSTMNGLARVRSGIASFRSRAVIAGNDPYPTLAELTTLGTVLDRPIPANPWSGLDDVRAASRAEAEARTVVSSDTYGWGYFVDNASSPPVAIFYANCTDTTARVDGSDGTFLNANEL